MNRNETLQSLCREYLGRLKDTANNLGLLHWVNKTIEDSEKNKCEATEEQVEMLARMCDDERVSRSDVPKLLGKSYRKSFEDGDFENIKTLKHVGIYSKVKTLLFKSEKS
jgi:predicted transcriptional regulator